MAFTFIASAEAEDPDPGTTLDCTSSLNVAAGDLLVAAVKYEGANGTFAIASVSGSPANTFTVDAGDEENHSSGQLNATFAYVLSAAADATAVFRLTTESREFRGIIVMQFRPDGGDTVSKLAAAEGQGTGTAAQSGLISPTGDDIVALGLFAQFADVVLSNRAINSVAADAFQDAAATDFSMWYRILTTGFTNGRATVTQDEAEDWICNVIAFGAAASSSPTIALPAGSAQLTGYVPGVLAGMANDARIVIRKA